MTDGLIAKETAEMTPDDPILPRQAAHPTSPPPSAGPVSLADAKHGVWYSFSDIDIQFFGELEVVVDSFLPCEHGGPS